MKKTTAGPAELQKWLLTRKTYETWESVGKMIGVSRGHACLLAYGKAEPSAELLARWRRRWLLSPSAMRRALPRLVRNLNARILEESEQPRVYGRNGRRA